MRHFALLLLSALTAVSSATPAETEEGPRNSPPSGLLAGVARADISPPVGIAQLNWGSQTHVEAVGIDPAGFVATALVVSDGTQKFAMVDIDTLSIREDLAAAIRLASERTGIPAAHIRLGASHTHAGPAYQDEKGPLGKDKNRYLPEIEAYRNQVAAKVVGAIVEANSKLRPVHVGGAKGTGTIAVNRRVRATATTPAAVGTNPEGTVDRDLIVVRIDNAEGHPYAILFNYQCHGTTLTYENKVISPDWVGMARRTIEQAFPGALSLFFQGATGDLGPVEGGTGDLGVSHRLGRILGHQAAALAHQIETVRREPVLEGFVESTAFAARQPWRVKGPRSGKLAFAGTILKVPRRVFSPEDIDGMSKQVEAARQKLELARQGSAWDRYQAEARLRRAEDLLAAWKRPPDPEPLPVELQALRIGEVAIVAMPGEPFSGIGTAVRGHSPFAFTLFCGYSSGQGSGYMPTADEYAHGGYEVEMSPYAPAAAGMVVEASLELLAKLK